MKTRIIQTYNNKYKPQYQKYWLWFDFKISDSLVICGKYIQAADFLTSVGDCYLYNEQQINAMQAISANSPPFNKVEFIALTDDKISISFDGQVRCFKFPKFKLGNNKATHDWAIECTGSESEGHKLVDKLAKHHSQKIEELKACIPLVKEAFKHEVFKDIDSKTVVFDEEGSKLRIYVKDRVLETIEFKHTLDGIEFVNPLPWVRTITNCKHISAKAAVEAALKDLTRKLL